MNRRDPSNFEWFHKDSAGDAFDLDNVANKTPMYYLTTSDLNSEIGVPPASFVGARGPFCLYAISEIGDSAFLRYLHPFLVQ